tara:strand:- start:331 stop:444 length:114 start_codon:yes stop_codon:yes gene_type:complete
MNEAAWDGVLVSMFSSMKVLMWDTGIISNRDNVIVEK